MAKAKETGKKAACKACLPKTMKAMVFYEPNKMELVEVPVPKPKKHEVLLNVKSVGICGSDVAYYFGKSSLETEDGKGPLVLGHEYTGQVVAVGAEAAQNGFKVGDRVVANPVQACRKCKWCKQQLSNVCTGEKRVLGVSVDGGFAEYSLSDYRWTVKLAKNVTYDQGALTEPLACGLYAANNLNIEPGQNVAVFGPGPIGLMMVQILKFRGAKKVILVGTRDDRLELGKKLGASVIVNVKDPKSPHYAKDLEALVRSVNKGELLDRAITATSSPDALKSALSLTGAHATLVIFGLPGDKDVLPVPILDTIFQDKTIRFSWLSPNTWQEAVKLVASGAVKLDKLITHRFKLDELIDGLGKARDRVDNCVKAVVQVSE